MRAIENWSMIVLQLKIDAVLTVLYTLHVSLHITAVDVDSPLIYTAMNYEVRIICSSRLILIMSILSKKQNRLY